MMLPRLLRNRKFDPMLWFLVGVLVTLAVWALYGCESKPIGSNVRAGITAS
jgi:hypothetical protein